MLAQALTSLWKALWMPSVIVTSAVTTVAATLAYRGLGVERGFWNLPWETMQILAVVVVARYWASLTVTASALRVMRRGFVRAPIYWVPAPTAFRVAAVSLVLTLPVMALALLLVVPGVWLALRWSQAPMLILDEQAQWFDAAQASDEMTAGWKLRILGVWLMVAIVLAAAGWFDWVFTDMLTVAGAPAAIAAVPGLLVRIAADAVGLVMPAAIYYELDVE